MSTPRLSATTVVADAADLADTAGFDSVTLSAVARRLGVQTPSLYSHVRDLAALRDGITALALDELSALISEAIAGRSGKRALIGFADAHRAYATLSPGRWQSLQRRAGPAAVDSGAARRFVDMTDAVLLGYGLSAVARVHATRLLGSTINGFLTLERIGSFDHSAPSPEESWAVALDALDRLLRSWPANSHNEPTPQGTTT